MYTNMNNDYYSAAQEPTQPKNLKINSFVQTTLIGQSEVFHTLSIGWDAPDNMGNFDLEYYIVQTVVSEPIEAIFNGTTTEHVYVFNFNQPVQGSVVIRVTAVSKCSQHSLTTSTVVDAVASDAELDFLGASIQNSEGELSHLCNAA